jgi:DNA-binding MarR family transcriptional regulator
MTKAAKHTERVISDPQISSSAKLIWLFLGTMGESPFRVNVHEIHRKFGMSRNTVWRSLQQLQDKGWLTWQRSKGGDTDYEGRCGLVTISPRYRPPIY